MDDRGIYRQYQHQLKQQQRHPCSTGICQALGMRSMSASNIDSQNGVQGDEAQSTNAPMAMALSVSILKLCMKPTTAHTY
ncbi:unnamed protein product [Ceratitis capitata]|uniref:(Mediterranean fruit fly) hypothetical protein n=1 Tax=Ceratitis capitata TaxID=7213 RepID=A0A811UN63_CERCA|nr:unnamed protein product [Ceratitis capitata]